MPGCQSGAEFLKWVLLRLHKCALRRVAVTPRWLKSAEGLPLNLSLGLERRNTRGNTSFLWWTEEGNKSVVSCHQHFSLWHEGGPLPPAVIVVFLPSSGSKSTLENWKCRHVLFLCSHVPSSYFCFRAQWPLKIATRIFAFQESLLKRFQAVKGQSREAPRSSSCIYKMHSPVLRCVSMDHKRRYYTWLHLPSAESSATAQRGSNNRTLRVHFVHNYMRRHGCVPAGAGLICHPEADFSIHNHKQRAAEDVSQAAQANLNDPWPFSSLSVKPLVSGAWGSQRLVPFCCAS